MSDAVIQVPPNSTGEKVDTEQLTVGLNTVQRQRIQIAGTSALEIAPVSATNGLAVDAKTLAPDAATETTLGEIAANALDYDTGGGTVPQVVLGLALPGSGGPVAGGTATNPIQVSLANTAANATPVKVDGSAATQPVSAVALPLPTGAATSALQTQPGVDIGDVTINNAAGAAAVNVQDGGNSITVDGAVTVTQGTATSLKAEVIGAGTAGTANAGVLTIQGIAGMTKVQVTPDANSAINLAQVNAQTVNVGAGNAGVGTQRISISTDDVNLAAINAVNGVISGAAVITDANGTIQQYLRGLVKLAITAGGFLVTATLAAGANLIGQVGFKRTYGAVVTMTTTNFSGLTNTSGWQSASIATGGASEIQFLLETLGAAGSTAFVEYYLAEAFTSGSFVDGATGSEGTFTAANRKNAIFVGNLLLNGTTAVRGMLKYTIVSGTLPERVVLLAINNSGGTISATGGNTVFGYELIN